MKQLTIRQVTRLTAKTLRTEPFEVVERKKPIGRYLPYTAGGRHAPFRHNFTAQLESAYGPLKKQGKGKLRFPELAELANLP